MIMLVDHMERGRWLMLLIDGTWGVLTRTEAAQSWSYGGGALKFQHPLTVEVGFGFSIDVTRTNRGLPNLTVSWHYWAPTYILAWPEEFGPLAVTDPAPVR